LGTTPDPRVWSLATTPSPSYLDLGTIPVQRIIFLSIQMFYNDIYITHAKGVPYLKTNNNNNKIELIIT